MSDFLNGEKLSLGEIHQASSMYLKDAAALGRFDAGRLMTLEKQWKAEYDELPSEVGAFSFANALQTFEGTNGQLTFMYSPKASSFVLLGFELKPSTRGTGNVVLIAAKGARAVSVPVMRGLGAAALSAAAQERTAAFDSLTALDWIRECEKINRMLADCLADTAKRQRLATGALTERQRTLLRLIARHHQLLELYADRAPAEFVAALAKYQASQRRRRLRKTAMVICCTYALGLVTFWISGDRLGVLELGFLSAVGAVAALVAGHAKEVPVRFKALAGWLMSRTVGRVNTVVGNWHNTA